MYGICREEIGRMRQDDRGRMRRGRTGSWEYGNMGDDREAKKFFFFFCFASHLLFFFILFYFLVARQVSGVLGVGVLISALLSYLCDIREMSTHLVKTR